MTIQAQSNWLSPPGRITTVFHYQKEFSIRANNETSALWDSMFPRGRGFIRDPDLSPEPTCVAVYHQLHCLDAIRTGTFSPSERITSLPDEPPY
ncbi:hypothetical protein N0V93_009813 [Gnomoniopsis smithogilvyi]|uniref:Uncharacterized protein n=1 Tax=Gnomoniopsis smithogilvyi TaxID=1191159 RepID=A0A9W8YIU4_9PEZI|nr:hypothetical protein N0V93_009813 [Gnomoniopsis smithogilvyi]